jgi:hypothetical protein
MSKKKKKDYRVDHFYVTASICYVSHCIFRLLELEDELHKYNKGGKPDRIIEILTSEDKFDKYMKTSMIASGLLTALGIDK